MVYGSSQARVQLELQRPAYAPVKAVQDLSHQPAPQPQQFGIQATSATYTTVHSNARSLTH